MNQTDNFFSRMDKKQKKKFYKLSDKEKTDIISAEINKKVTDTLNKRVGEAFMDGYLFAHKILKERYVDKPSNSQEEYTKNIAGLIEEIDEGNRKYERAHVIPKKDNQDNTEEEN